jgi:hypothetical protein
MLVYLFISSPQPLFSQFVWNAFIFHVYLRLPFLVAFRMYGRVFDNSTRMYEEQRYDLYNT